MRIATLAAAAAFAASPALAGVFVDGDLPRKSEAPFVAVDGLDIHYGVADMDDGARLRTIIAKPEGARGRLPAIFFAQWVSCGSLEYVDGSVSRATLYGLARRSGRALVLVERSTSGDSVGPACNDLDYDTELAHYRQAYRELMTSPHIDASDVVVYGSSLGSTTAPQLALALVEDGLGLSGVMVQGGGAETYFERMVAFDNLYLMRREAFDASDLHRQIAARARFHTEYLINDRDPDDVARDSNEMAAIRADVRGLGDGDHYGRPYAWHQQLAKKDLAAAWARIEAPVLVVYNEYDQFELRRGHQMIAEIVNRLRPGTATFVEQKGIGHSNARYANAIDAYLDRNGTPASEAIAGVMLGWMAELDR